MTINATPGGWAPIETVPADRKDGRDVLLWAAGGYGAICSWDEGWRDAVGRELVGATHWADVEGPGGETCQGR